eukprot:1149012-Pelagomonas_calceolata.AAC.2
MHTRERAAHQYITAWTGHIAALIPSARSAGAHGYKFACCTAVCSDPVRACVMCLHLYTQLCKHVMCVINVSHGCPDCADPSFDGLNGAAYPIPLGQGCPPPA